MAPATISITVFPSNPRNTINRTIYSGFLEHMGRCIYGGLFDPSNPNPELLISPSSGLRKDVIETLKPLEIPVFRYPGGNFTATYHWLDGVGPISSRPKRANLAWGGQTEPNTFGTNEFMVWCREHMSAEPYLCLNMGTGTLDEALAWVEYCNGTGDTYYANLRREHLGHDRPHKVKYWGLGNEVWGPWQIAQTADPKQYAETAMQWAKAIKLLDPSVCLILCGKDGISKWDYEVINHCVVPAATSDLGVTQGPLIDMVSIHMYTASSDHYQNVFAPLAAERAIEVTGALIDLASAENEIPAGQKRPTICFDEWNVWDPRRAVGSLGAEEQYTLSDALAVAVWLNVFVRQSDLVEMACIAQSVNVISPLMTSKNGLTKQTSWGVYELFCRFVRGRRIDYVISGDEEYTSSTKPAWLKDSRGKRKGFLDVSACVDDTRDGQTWCCVAIASLREGKDMTISLEGCLKDGQEVEVYIVGGGHLDDTNKENNEVVKIERTSWKRTDTFSLRQQSFTLLRWSVNCQSSDAM